MNNKIKGVVCTASLFILLGCAQNSIDVDNEIVFDQNIMDTTDGDFVCRLKENIDFIGNNISDFTLLNDTSFVVLSAGNVFLYNEKGDQLKIINKIGSGPAECLTPASVYISENNIYIWCSSLLKILVYDMSGEYITQYTGFNRAISKFIVFKDKYVCLFTVGDNGREILRVYDILKNKIVGSFGEFGQEDILLSRAEHSGGVCVVGNNILYSYPSSLNIHQRDIVDIDDDQKVYHISDSEFKVTICENATQKINDGGIIEAIKYGFENSIVKDIHSYNDRIYVTSEIGKIVMGDKTLDISGRKIKIFELNYDFVPNVSKTYNYRPMMGFSFYKDSFYFLKIDSDSGDDRIISLMKYKI